MYLNCGQLIPESETRTVALEIWDGETAYRFAAGVSDISALLQERTAQIPLSQRFGLYETRERGRARLSTTGKGAVFWFDALPGRAFTVTRSRVAGVARMAARAPGERWLDAVVSEILPDPVPRAGTIRMGAIR